MSNTVFYKNRIEPHVRKWLSHKFRKPFESEEIRLKLRAGGFHRFDAVSKDRKIVAGIRSSVARKGTWQEGGKIKATYTEILFLSQVRAKEKLLVFTDKRFHEKFTKRSYLRYPQSVKLLYCPLPTSLRRGVSRSHKKSSREIGKRK